MLIPPIHRIQSVIRCSLPALLSAILLGVGVARSGEPPVVYAPQQIIDKSIMYHDPNGVWENGQIDLVVQTTYSPAFAERLGVDNASVSLLLSPGHEEFGYTREAGGDRVEVTVRAGVGVVSVNGSPEVSAEDRERLRLREPEMYRDYSEYLYGMPMKLRDSGTLLRAQANSLRFNDRVVWEVRVTYEPEVGEDIWYFYFDQETFALTGYRFYHDESKNDGEYITLEGEIIDEASGLRLPKTRSWYYNADDGHLATDDIVGLKVTDVP